MLKRIQPYSFMTIIFFFLSSSLAGQDYEWWNRKHNWDGTTHWTRYIILSPAYLGPNALPVQALRSGLIDTTTQFELAADLHRSPGDQTENIFNSLHIPIAKGVASLRLEMVIIERYQMDTLTRDERRARDEDGKGYSVGDLLVSTCFRIVRDKAYLPDMNLGVHLRTTTGTNLSGARFSDTPGFLFDLSMSKRFLLCKHAEVYLEPRAMLGFSSWQVNRDDNLQNDALNYGAGLRIESPNWHSQAEWAGYHGYFNNGDRPMLVRIQAGRRIREDCWLHVRFQQGLHDFQYSSYRLCFTLFLDKHLNAKRKASSSI